MPEMISICRAEWGTWQMAGPVRGVVNLAPRRSIDHDAMRSNKSRLIKPPVGNATRHPLQTIASVTTAVTRHCPKTLGDADDMELGTMDISASFQPLSQPCHGLPHARFRSVLLP